TLGRVTRAARAFLLGWIALGLAWLVLAGEIVAIHEYNALPLLPALALIAGLGLEYMWTSPTRGAHTMIVLALAVAPLAPIRYSPALRDGNVPPALVDIGDRLDALLPRSAHVVIGPDPSPVVTLYHAHRRGWTFPTVVTPATLGGFVNRGAIALVSADP